MKKTIAVRWLSVLLALLTLLSASCRKGKAEEAVIYKYIINK